MTATAYHTRWSAQCGSCSCLTGECRARGQSAPDYFDAWPKPSPGLEAAFATMTFTAANSWHEDDEAEPTEGNSFPASMATPRERLCAAVRRPEMAPSLGHPNPHRRLWRAE